MTMNDNTKQLNIGTLALTYDPASGQLLRVHDTVLNMDVISFAPGHELEINGLPLPLRLTQQDPLDLPAWQCLLEAEFYPTVGSSQGFRIFRQMVVGSTCRPGANHLNPPNALHLRYRVERRQMNDYTTPVYLSAGRRPIQAPLWLDTIGTLCGRTDWFGPQTRMLAAHFPGAGPREHVSLEDALVADVVPHLWNMYRRVHPGVQLIPGAAYYHPDGRWLWITCQRPSVGMHWDWSANGQAAQFEYHARLQPAEIVHTPEVSLYWGRGGRAEMLAFMNNSFIGYEEPHQDWWYRTCWHWMGWWGYRPRGYDDMADQAEYLNKELGLTGFALLTHDLRPGNWDCSASGLRPSPHTGGDAGIRRFMKRVKAFGGHVYSWWPWCGISQPSIDLKQHWVIRGEDGRPYESFYSGNLDMYQAVNFDHPEVQAYYLDWIKRYIGDYGLDGMFWDCGGIPLPPDFSPPETRPFQRFPSECMTSGYRFMEKVMQVGRACNPDFFMWHECFSTDLPGTGYSTHCGCDPFLFELNRHGTKRLVFRSSSVYNLYGGFPGISPREDSGVQPYKPVTIESYRPVVQDQMNRWLVRFIKEHGCRDAIGLASGVSLCADHIVVDPGTPRSVTVPGAPRKLRNVLTGAIVTPTSTTPEGTVFELPGQAAYALD